jgi:hypothetical protein
MSSGGVASDWYHVRYSNTPLVTGGQDTHTDVNPVSSSTCAGTVVDIPFDSSSSPHYLIMFDNGTTRSVHASSQCQPSFPNPSLLIQGRVIFFHPFLRLALRLHMNTMANTIKVSSLNQKRVLISLATSPISTRSPRIGASTFPIYLQHGRTYVLMASSYHATSHPCSFALHPLPLILSVLTISNWTAPAPSWLGLSILIQIVPSGLIVIERRSPTFNHTTLTSKLALLNTARFKLKVPPAPSL